MKYGIVLAALSLLIVSCSAEEATTKKEVEWVKFGKMQVKKSDMYTTRPAGIPPYGHKYYFLEGPDYDLEGLDKLYKEEFNHPDSLALDYNSNLKNRAFNALINKGLAEKGSPQQKNFYIEEQLKLDMNLSTISNFNELLMSCRAFKDENEIKAIAAQFYEKNKQEIEDIKWRTQKERKDKLQELSQEYDKVLAAVAVKK